jgi:hypothetical protein
MPFFPRVLVHLIGFDHGVTQRVAVQPQPREFLEAVPQLQQVLAVAAQLARHLGGGPAGGDAVQDQHQLRGAAMRPLEGGPAPGVEGAAAVAALVVQDRLAVAVVDARALSLTAGGAGQAVGVEQLDQLAVAGALVQVVNQGEIHDGALRASGCISLEANSFRVRRQDAGHGFRPMSQPRNHGLPFFY